MVLQSKGWIWGNIKASELRSIMTNKNVYNKEKSATLYFKVQFSLLIN